jgi:hypothetical protein
MENQGMVSVMGIRDIWLKTITGCKLQLKDVGHMPNIHMHLIITGILDEEGYHN